MRPAATALLCLVLACVPKPIPFDPPPKTGWTPEGCRAVPVQDPVLGGHTTWKNLHADALNTDEVSIAIGPVFRRQWHAEPLTLHYGGPVFDRSGNLYVTPLLPPEDVILISLDPADGSRRWAVGGSGTGGGGGTPMVLNDPDRPGEEMIFVGLYDRAFAVRPDGSVVWDVATGLVPAGDFASDTAYGVNYLPALDAVAGITGDGRIYLLDRTTGGPLLATPHSLPGTRSPAGDLPLPQAIMDRAFDELAAFMGGFPPGFNVQDLISMLQGNHVEVGNFFSVDPATGRLWVAATAPDAEDGFADGVSEYGALYGLDVVFNGGVYEIVEACHRYYAGGSASTPALRADGTRIYIGDNEGNLIAVDTDCNEVWTFDVGVQVAGSVGVSSDNGELYVSGPKDIVQVIDLGDRAEEGWRADLQLYVPGPGQQNLNSNLYSIAANGIGFQAGAGYLIEGYPMLLTVGVGVLDRGTGQVRHFIDDLDETIAVMSTGPDGALYIGSSPLRRSFARAILGEIAPPLEGGIRKYGIARPDLLLRDAVCAAADRTANACAYREICPASAGADRAQIRDLIHQFFATLPQAIQDESLLPIQGHILSVMLATAYVALLPSWSVCLAEAPLRFACGMFD